MTPVTHILLSTLRISHATHRRCAYRSAAGWLWLWSAAARSGSSASSPTSTVSVTGTFDKAPQVKIPKEAASGKLSITTPIKGTGPALTTG